jgi:hypothetical protein
MSLIFNQKAAKGSGALRAMKQQFDHLNGFRTGNHATAMQDFLTATNAGVSPADAYREFDATTKIEVVPAGHLATLTRLMQKSRSVSIGREVFDYRKASRNGTAKTSMSGQTGVVIDQSQYKYGGTVVPIHDDAYGRTWREVEAMKAEGFDAMVDDSREAERTVMEKIEDYLWNGNADVSVKGRSWLGLRSDPTVANAVIGVDLASAASTALEIFNEVKRLRDILYITNSCTNGLRLGVSLEIMSNWENDKSTDNTANQTILEYVGKLRGIVEIYEDAELTGNQIALYWDDQAGFHPVVGMALSSYPTVRQNHNDDYSFMKWAAVGFMAKTSYDDKKCALYAE